MEFTSGSGDGGRERRSLDPVRQQTERNKQEIKNTVQLRMEENNIQGEINHLNTRAQELTERREDLIKRGRELAPKEKSSKDSSAKKNAYETRQQLFNDDAIYYNELAGNLKVTIDNFNHRARLHNSEVGDEKKEVGLFHEDEYPEVMYMPHVSSPTDK